MKKNWQNKFREQFIKDDKAISFIQSLIRKKRNNYKKRIIEAILAMENDDDLKFDIINLIKKTK